MSCLHEQVPRDVQANLRWRRRVLAAANRCRETQRDLWSASARDLLFWVNTFGWTYSPKDFGDSPERPFVTWPCQDFALQKMADAVGKHDVVIEKSRDMGASWMCLVVFVWRWLFKPLQSFLLVSRNVDLVDRKNDPDCLMWKADYLLKNLPRWMKPPMKRVNLSIYNEHMGSSLVGATTTSETSRGGRKTAIMLDEFAAVDGNDSYAMDSSSRNVTECRFFNSTPQGASGAYFDLRDQFSRVSPERLITLHWSLHPLKNRGLYCSWKGKVYALGSDSRQYWIDRGASVHQWDAQIDYAPQWQDCLKNRTYNGYEIFNPEEIGAFVQDGKIRSPYYDNQCSRATNQQSIAQEEDIDYLGSGWQFFDPILLAEIKRETVMQPTQMGFFSYDRMNKKSTWHKAEKGEWRLWFTPLADGRVPREDKYVIGGDVGLGTGGKHSSSSTLSVANRATGRKVAEYSSQTTPIGEFAEIAVAAARFFNNAFLIWEANGPGASFTKEVVDVHKYRNVFYRQDEESVVRKVSDKPGWQSSRLGKQRLLSAYGEALKKRNFINPSDRALQECAQYVHTTTGEIKHAKSEASYDPTERGENHGDLVIADALANRGLIENPVHIHSPEPEIKPNSMAARMKEYEREDREKEEDYWE